MSLPAPSSVGDPRVTPPTITTEKALKTTTTTRALQILRFWAYSESPHINSITKDDIQRARAVLQLGENDLPAPPLFIPVAPGMAESMSWPANWETNRMSLVLTLRWLGRRSKDTRRLNMDVDARVRGGASMAQA